MLAFSGRAGRGDWPHWRIVEVAHNRTKPVTEDKRIENRVGR
jgi:hypothetical protein